MSKRKGEKEQGGHPLGLPEAHETPRAVAQGNGRWDPTDGGQVRSFQRMSVHPRHVSRREGRVQHVRQQRGVRMSRAPRLRLG